MASIKSIEGIGPAYAQKLAEAGISTTGALLKKGASPQGRKEIEEATGISGTMILRWVNMADLFRVKGVGEVSTGPVPRASKGRPPQTRSRGWRDTFSRQAWPRRRWWCKGSCAST